MISKNTVWKDSEKFGERNDCSVKAVALATGTKYAKVHYEFAKQGRKQGRGTHRYQQEAVLAALGFELKLVHVGHYVNENVKNKFKAKTITTLERELPSRGVFLVYTRGHMLCARGGKILDWTQGRRHQIREVFRVVKIKKSAPKLQRLDRVEQRVSNMPINIVRITLREYGFLSSGAPGAARLRLEAAVMTGQIPMGEIL